MGNKYHYTKAIYDFFLLVSEERVVQKKKNQSEQDFFFLSRIVFSFPVTIFWSMCEISERVACHS